MYTYTENIRQSLKNCLKIDLCQFMLMFYVSLQKTKKSTPK